LETELEQVKALAAPNGPKRFGSVSSVKINETANLAANYRAKSAASLDRALAQGYLEKAIELEKSESN